MIAWLLVWRSQWAVQDLDARQAIALADAARRTPGATDQMHSLTVRQQARGHALDRDAAACERSLADARQLLDRADPARAPDLGGPNLTPPYVLVAEARCWIELAPSQAISMFEDALRIWPHDRPARRGVQQARLAQACAAAGEPERAAAEGLTALAITQSTGSSGTVRELRQLDRRLAGCDVSEAAEFREAFAAL